VPVSDSPSLDVEAPSQLLSAFESSEDTERARRLAVVCLSSILSSLSEEDRHLLQENICHEQYGLDAMHRLEYMRAYHDRLHRYVLSSTRCASRIVEAAARKASSASDAFTSMKEIAGLLGRIDGNLVLAQSDLSTAEFEEFQMQWYEAAKRAGKEGRGASLAGDMLANLELTTTSVEDSGPPAESLDAPERVIELRPTDDLCQVLGSIEPEAIIRFLEGDHHVRTRVVIPTDVAFEGSAGARVVQLEAGNVTVPASARVEVRSIQFASETEAIAASEFWLVEGEVEFKSSSFGLSHDIGDESGRAERKAFIRVAERGRVEMDSCLFSDFTNGACRVEGQARLRASGAVFSGGEVALVVAADAMAEMRECQLVDQKRSGVATSGHGRARLIHCKLFGSHSVAAAVAVDESEVVLEKSILISTGEFTLTQGGARVIDHGSEIRPPTPFE
jgi:hypothetical protein